MQNISKGHIIIIIIQFFSVIQGDNITITQNQQVTLKANTESKNKDGLTQLHVAAINGCFSTTKELIEAGSSIEALDPGMNTPLVLASQHGNLAVYFID